MLVTCIVLSVICLSCDCLVLVCIVCLLFRSDSKKPTTQIYYHVTKVQRTSSLCHVGSLYHTRQSKKCENKAQENIGEEKKNQHKISILCITINKQFLTPSQRCWSYQRDRQTGRVHVESTGKAEPGKRRLPASRQTVNS